MARTPTLTPAHVTFSEYMTTTNRRPEVQAMMAGLVALETLTSQIIEFQTRLRSDFLKRNGTYPAGFDYEDVPPDEPDPDKRGMLLVSRLEALKGKRCENTLRRWSHARDQLAWAIRDWRDELHRSRARLGTVAPLMDDPAVVVVNQWTSRLRRLLNEHGGCLPPDEWASLPTIDDAVLASKLGDFLSQLREFTDALKAIGPPAPSPASVGIQTKGSTVGTWYFLLSLSAEGYDFSPRETQWSLFFRAEGLSREQARQVREALVVRFRDRHIELRTVPSHEWNAAQILAFELEWEDVKAGRLGGGQRTRRAVGDSRDAAERMVATMLADRSAPTTDLADANDARAASRVEFLQFLTDQGGQPVDLMALPAALRDVHVLTVMDFAGLIEFGQRKHWHEGSELKVLDAWDGFTSMSVPGKKPMADFLAEWLGWNGDDRIRPHVRLTAKGRAEASRLVLAAQEMEARPHAASRILSSSANPMSWQEAKQKAEQHVKRDSGTFPGRNTLADDIVHCSRATMTKAIRKSTYLTARQAEAKANAKKVGRATPISSVVADQLVVQDSEQSSLDRLIAEQTAEAEREERQHASARRRPVR